MTENNTLIEENLPQEDAVVQDVMPDVPQSEEKPEAIQELATPEEAQEPEVLNQTEESAPAEETASTEAPAPAEETASTEDLAPMEDVAPTEESTETAPAEGAPTDIPAVRPYHERYYLRYREGKRSAPMDLEGTKAFLQELGFDGGELRQARAGKDFAETYRNATMSKGNQMYCSYCGTEIAGVEFFRLPDGRIRCTTCSKTVLQTKAEVEELCQRVMTNLENFFGATIDVPVSIEVVDERKLKKKVGVPLGTPDSQSLLILGVAVNKKKKYSVILENGAPRISVIATFAHELTHIWQYTHWDNKKNFPECPKDKRLLIYEGMAKWVEIQYLYLIGETAVAKREEYITRQREDEYGMGFRLYEDQYPLSRDAMSCDETPFTVDRYPLDEE